MTERQGTVEGQAQEGQDQPQWRVEGAESSEDGLGDTVVRLPKITDDGPAPTLPAPPKVRPNRTGRGGASAAAPRQPAAPDAGKQRMSEPLDTPTQIQPASVRNAGGANASNGDAAAAGAVATAPVAPTLPPSPFSRPEPYVAPAFSEPPAVTSPTTPMAAAPVAAAPMAAAPVAAPPAAKPASKPSGLRRTRKARLRLSRVDPWSVMKTSFLFSIAFGIMFWVAVSVVWTVIVSSGLFDVINQGIQNILSSPNSTTTWRIEDYVNANKVLGVAALLAVINVVISTALGTLAAFLYNLSANILGGLELTLAED